MRRAIAIAALTLWLPVALQAQTPAPAPSPIEKGKHLYETLFTKPIRLSLEPIAPTAGVTAGIGYKPKVWRTPSQIRILGARASASTHGYWAVDGSFAWQNFVGREWRVEPYARFRSMKRLNYFGLGNESALDDRADYSMLDRRVGAYGYFRPVGWLALGGRSEGLWERTSAGESPDLPSVDEKFSADALPGFNTPTNYIYAGGFVNLNYPYVRSERPRRGGDYGASFGTFHDTSGSGHSFNRFELEGQERFPIAGVDRLLTLHGRLSSSFAGSGQAVPFYLMDTIGGADNLRGFKEAIIGGDEATATLRPFESFRFRDNATLFFQVDFHQRVYSQIFVSVFGDLGMVASSVGDLGSARAHNGIGIGLSIYRVNVLVLRAEMSFWGEGTPFYFTPGRGLGF